MDTKSIARKLALIRTFTVADLKNFQAAIETLSDEVVNIRAANWGIVNRALLKASALLREIEGRE